MQGERNFPLHKKYNRIVTKAAYFHGFSGEREEWMLGLRTSVAAEPFAIADAGVLEIA
jgi:hypothetical protein